MVLELESKSTMVTCDLYIAHTDGSLRKEQPDMNNVFDDSRIKSLRLINALSYALTTIVVLSSIHTSSNNQYDDYEVWMANQTLLSVAPHTQYIWYPLFILQGLFIAASYLPSLWSSELLGYTALAAETGYKKSLPVVHYSALCASTLMMMYSVKLNIMSLAFAGSCVSTYFLAHIIKYQLDTGTTPTDENADGILGSRKQIQQYVFLKLPFELYAGYNFALNVAFLNIIMHKLFGSVVFNVMLSSVSLVVMLVVGCYVTWMEKNWWCCGIGGGMAWYLVSIVCVKNFAPSLTRV